MPLYALHTSQAIGQSKLPQVSLVQRLVQKFFPIYAQYVVRRRHPQRSIPVLGHAEYLCTQGRGRAHRNMKSTLGAGGDASRWSTAGGPAAPDRNEERPRGGGRRGGPLPHPSARG